MTINTKLMQKLNYIERLLNDPSSFSEEEKKDKPSDGILVKALKNNIRTSELINQKDKTIQSLQLKNEKLTQSYKKLVNYFAQARKQIVHLQGDLAFEKKMADRTEKQLEDKIFDLQTKVEKLTPNQVEKNLLYYVDWKNWKQKDWNDIKSQLENPLVLPRTQLRPEYLNILNKLIELVNALVGRQHIQKELNDTLAILNKPTAEMGTQTDLTTEQITQMEKDLEYQQKLLYQGALGIDKLEKELSKINEEQTKRERIITDLKTKVKDLTPTPTENELINLMGNWIYHLRNKEASIALLEKLKEERFGLVRGNFASILWNLQDFAERVLRKIELEEQVKQKSKELTTKNQELTQLQTKYDMEVRSKEELIKFLNIYRSSSVAKVKSEDLDIFMSQHNYHHFEYLRIDVSKSSEIDFNYPNKFFSILEISNEDGGKKEKGLKTVLKMPSHLAKQFNIIEIFGTGGNMFYDVVKYRNVSFLKNYNPRNYKKDKLVFYYSGNFKGLNGDVLEIKEAEAEIVEFE